MGKFIKSSLRISEASGVATVDDKRKRYEALMPRYSELLQDTGIRIVKVNKALVDYGTLVFRASLFIERDNLYDNCCTFLDKFDELRHLLSNMDEVYSQIINMLEELSNPSPTFKEDKPKDNKPFQKINTGLKDDKPFQKISTAEITRNLTNYIKNPTIIKFIISRLRRKDLGDLRVDSAEIKGNDIPDTIFNILEYCEARGKIHAFIQSICEEMNLKEEEILTNLLRDSSENTSDKFD